MDYVELRMVYFFLHLATLNCLHGCALHVGHSLRRYQQMKRVEVTISTCKLYCWLIFSDQQKLLIEILVY